MIIAGEASGDLHGAKLVNEILPVIPNLEISGMGSHSMKKAGVNLLADISQYSVCGFVEVLGYLPKLYSLFKKIKKQLIEQAPDLLILIDYPTFNLRLAKVAAKHNIKVLYYISPQIWAWHTSRVKKIRKCVNQMAVIFPFESDFYRKNSVPVKYVGHPLVGLVTASENKSEIKNQYDLNAQDIIVGLLPGSRNNEIKYILPTLVKSAQLLHQHNSKIKFLLPLADTLSESELRPFFEEHRSIIKLVTQNRYDAMSICDVVIVASGTATLELALLGVPMVVVYKANSLSFQLAKRLVKIPHVGLCNIVAGKKIAEELLQENASAENIKTETLRLIEDQNYREQQTKELKIVTSKLAAARDCSLAELVFDLVKT
jgi:lipid-A-disaccharide synthase